MRNLRNTAHAAFEFPKSLPAITAAAWDGDDIICCFGPTGDSPAITLKRLPNGTYDPEQALSIASWDSPSPNPDIAVDRVLDLHCLQDSGAFCLVLQGGDIVLVREDPQPGQDLIEIVGSVDAGITAAAWSPEEELLVIASRADTLLYMTRDLEGITSVNLTPDDLQISNHVSVGWGKAETQFKGRGAKALRDPTVPEHVDAGRLSTYDDARVTISWRGDGQYVAINSILKAEVERRVIRVYSRDGVLDSVSEPVDGLEAALSWKPSGQIIAGIQRHSERIDVVFFERNGLRHGEFALRLSKDQIDAVKGDISLAWNNDSTVLAVALHDRLQLWTMGNYHYYLKQEIVSDLNTYYGLSPTWHSEQALKLLVHAGRDLRSLAYQWHVSRGSNNSRDDRGVVAVIDGKTLKITPLRTANVPPPMAYDEIELSSNAIDVAVGADGKTIAVLHADEISFLACDYSLRPVKKAVLTDRVPLSTAPSKYARQLELNDGSTATVMSSEAHVAYTALERSDGTQIDMEDGHAITWLFRPSNVDGIFYYDSRGNVNECGANESGSLVDALPRTPIAVDLWQEGDTRIAFSLTANGVLNVISASQTLKITGCTSFAVAGAHLIYTTSQHFLKFVHLYAGKLEEPADGSDQDERCRAIERGAKIVTVIPNAYSLVLQMPRGNLETIFPRALVLAGIRRAIEARNYKEAFSICRTHRVDINILYDYAPKQFMQDIGLFVEQVKKVEHVDLFLSSLSAEDVTKTIYKDTINLAAQVSEIDNVQTAIITPQTNNSSKINSICDGFLEILRGKDAKYLQSIVTCHVCKSPPDLEGGLRLISDLRQAKDQAQLERAVEHICFLADVNHLYDASLGIYDLDVALLVAQQSQKDPREYLPYLQKLHELQPLRQKFAIDNDLKKYNRALSHLFQIGEFEELKAFTIKHELYSAATELYRYDNARLLQLVRLHADFLSERHRYKEAALAYEYVSEHQLAHGAYRAANMWRECLSSAVLMDMPEEAIASVARDLADSLTESKDFVAAAAINLDYLNDVETSTRLLCKGYKFSEAIRQVTLRRQSHMIKDVVDPGLIEASATMTEMLAEMRTQLSAQLPRLREVRQIKADDPVAFLDGGMGGDEVDVPDNISLAPTDASTSGGTFMTRYTSRSTGTLATAATRRTSKNRRKEERKRARGKKGTIYEEEYLVNSVARLIERLNTTGEDIRSLIEALMRRSMRERAIAVDVAYREVVSASRACADEVFASTDTGTSGVSPPQADGTAQASRPWGGQGVLWDALSASQKQKEAPILAETERLSLI